LHIAIYYWLICTGWGTAIYFISQLTNVITVTCPSHFIVSAYNTGAYVHELLLYKVRESSACIERHTNIIPADDESLLAK